MPWHKFKSEHLGHCRSTGGIASQSDIGVNSFIVRLPRAALFGHTLGAPDQLSLTTRTVEADTKQLNATKRERECVLEGIFHLSAVLSFMHERKQIKINIMNHKALQSVESLSWASRSICFAFHSFLWNERASRANAAKSSSTVVNW